MLGITSQSKGIFQTDYDEFNRLRIYVYHFCFPSKYEWMLFYKEKYTQILNKTVCTIKIFQCLNIYIYRRGS